MRIIIAIAIYLLFPIIIVSAFHKWKILQKIGTVILAYAVGIIMSLTGFVTFEPGTADAAKEGQGNADQQGAGAADD